MLQLIELSKRVLLTPHPPLFVPTHHRLHTYYDLDNRYSVILMDVLYQMMRETHLVNKKVVLLTRNAGHATLMLACVIINNIPKYKCGDLEVSRPVCTTSKTWCQQEHSLSLHIYE